MQRIHHLMNSLCPPGPWPFMTRSVGFPEIAVTLTDDKIVYLPARKASLCTYIMVCSLRILNPTTKHCGRQPYQDILDLFCQENIPVPWHGGRGKDHGQLKRGLSFEQKPDLFSEQKRRWHE